VTLNELVGWPAENVTATLGQPDEKEQGRFWRSPTDPFTSMTVDEAGKAWTVHVFGHVPKHIPALTPYEEWVYHNVHGQTWVLYLTRAPVSGQGETGLETASSSEWPRHSFWQKVVGLFRARPRTTVRQQVLAGPQVVVEVWCYPTGAVF